MFADRVPFSPGSSPLKAFILIGPQPGVMGVTMLNETV
jgi:hypothetical protein